MAANQQAKRKATGGAGLKHRTAASIQAMTRLWSALDEVLGDWTNAGKPCADEETINRDEQALKEALEAFRKAERRG